MNILRTLLILLLFASVEVCQAASKADFLPVDSVFIERVLAEAKDGKATGNMALFFARKFIGRPYVAHTLEKNDIERLVVNTRELDCTTLVENVTALTLCAGSKRYTFSDFLAVLEQLRYRRGKLDGYTSRLHYFSDWIADKTAMGVVADIQGPVPPFTAVKKLNIYYMSKNSRSYKALRLHPEFVADIRKQERALSGATFRYIPKASVANAALLRGVINDGDIIAIVSNKGGLDIAHLGFAVWHADGLHLLNASMIHRKVVDEPMTLYRYLQKHPSHAGLRILRIITQ